jgi:ComF family protein
MLNVKNTMIDNMLSVVAPHLCSGCGKIGSPICYHCKENIIKHPFIGCVVCELPSETGICEGHKMPYSQAWIVGKRQGILQYLIGIYKFQNVKAAAKSLAELLDRSLPPLPAHTVIIPIPTTPSHIRERGYDHMLLIAQYFAYIRKLQIKTDLLVRRSGDTQHIANLKQRMAQARAAFQLSRELEPDKTYLILDDIFTTGATVGSAARLFKEKGAAAIWIAVIARQPLD